jgi:hypothetical protein
MTLIHCIIFIATFTALAVVLTLASCYFFPEVPKAWIANDPWYEVRHAWQDRSTMLAFAAFGGLLGLLVFAAHCWLSQKLPRTRRPRRGFCAACGYDLRTGHTTCPECGSVVASPAGSPPAVDRSQA